MKESEAIDIMRLLAAGFHRESIEPETTQIWVELILPFDADIASRLALSWVKTSDTFPTMNQFRHAYHGEVKRSKPVVHDQQVKLDRMGLPVTDCPEWVQRYKLARAANDMRVFPEQIADGPKWHDDPIYTLAEAEEIGIMPEDAYPLDGR